MAEYEDAIKAAAGLLPKKFTEGYSTEGIPGRLAKLVKAYALKVKGMKSEIKQLKERDLVGKLPQRVKDNLNQMALGYGMDADKVVQELIHREYRVFRVQNPKAATGGTQTKADFEANDPRML